MFISAVRWPPLQIDVLRTWRMDRSPERRRGRASMCFYMFNWNDWNLVELFLGSKNSSNISWFGVKTPIKGLIAPEERGLDVAAREFPRREGISVPHDADNGFFRRNRPMMSFLNCLRYHCIPIVSSIYHRKAMEISCVGNDVKE